MKLITAGCSYTYGHGLKDCFIPPNGYGPEPSQYAWPAVLAKKLNIECVNLALPGGSNSYIVQQVTNYEPTIDDVVVILWSFFTRETFLDENKLTQHGEWEEDYMKHKFEFSNVTDNFLKQFVQIFLLTKHLENIGCKFLYSFMDHYKNIEVYEKYREVKNKFSTYIDKHDCTDNTFTATQLRLHENKYLGDIALDGSHPGELWHKDFADLIFNELEQKYK